jgi:hypothetical protein
MSDGALTEPIEISAAPGISWQASELIESWHRVLNQTDGDVRPNLERASVELLRLAQIEPGSKQAIVDELANLALIAGIDDDEAQAIFARAAEAPPDPINGRATAELAASKMHRWHSLYELSRPFDSRRSVITIWSKDCSQMPDSPSFGDRPNAAKLFGQSISVCTLRSAGITAATGCSRLR